MAIYDCECGCGKEVEKIIVFSQACRMKLRRKSVMKDNRTVIKHNKEDDASVNNHNADVMNDNEDVTQAYQEPSPAKCPFCYDKHDFNDDIGENGGYYCDRFKRPYTTQ